MNNKPQVTLAPLEPDDKEQFILDKQEVFKYGATIEFGMRDDHYEEDDGMFRFEKVLRDK